MARPSRTPRGQAGLSGLSTARPAVLGISKLLFLGLSTAAAPLGIREHNDHDHGDTTDPDSPSTWVLYIVSVVLVLLGGAFAGLTIALMGQDDIYLQVLSRDETEPQNRNAGRVYNLLKKGKHWVLVTLLLGNVIVNETLPVVLDRCLGGGVAAVVGSTFLIVIFGEILPQSICVRYGLQIGGFMSKSVLLLMWLMAPIAWPTAKLLDWLLGEDHGTVYKKSGLKTLVTLHRSLGEVSQRLNQDEVTIISAVLDLKEKPVEKVMTPMEDVFVMAEDTVLDEEMMDMILAAGYSRIPIHEPGNPTNFVGMLLVKILITYDPEDCMRVRDFPLATLPETRPETSCLDIINFFQEGKSHMVLVSEYPGEDHGALGVVTLEDVTEELIGEEIIDESDVYIDVHKAIRRMAPAPKARLQRTQSGNSQGVATTSDERKAVEQEPARGRETPTPQPPHQPRTNSVGSLRDVQSSPVSPAATLVMRRRSAGIDGRLQSAVPVRTNIDEIRQHLRHLGPSNRATNPRNTRLTTVKIKPGTTASTRSRGGSLQSDGVEQVPAEEGDETTTLLVPKGLGKDGVRALRQSYGSVIGTEAQSRLAELSPPADAAVTDGPVEEDQLLPQTPTRPSKPNGTHGADGAEVSPGNRLSVEGGGSPGAEGNAHKSRSYVRSGSITENVVETRGIRKVVLETTSSTDDDEEAAVPRALESSQFSRSRTSLNASATVSDVEEEEEGNEEGENGSEEVQADGSHSGAGAKRKNRRRKRRSGPS